MLEKTRVNLEISVIEKEILEIYAKEHGESLSALFRKGARLLGSLTPGFLETVEAVCREAGAIQAPVALELSLQKRVAAERAWMKVFDSAPPGILRELKYEGGKLIRGDDLSKILEHEYTELFQSIKEKFLVGQEKGEPVQLSTEEFSECCLML